MTVEVRQRPSAPKQREHGFVIETARGGVLQNVSQRKGLRVTPTERRKPHRLLAILGQLFQGQNVDGEEKLCGE